MKKICTAILICLITTTSVLAGTTVEQHSSKSNINNIEDYDMVIIAPLEFSNAIQPLIIHKNNNDIQTFLKTTEDIYSEFEGRDEAEQIKYFIKDAIESSNIKYVLLVGGRKGQSLQWYIPVRYVNNDFHIAESDFYHKKYISDLYFADVYKSNGDFEDWDSNNNNIFAEWYIDGNSKDTLDLIPDVSIGRLPCRSNEEVQSIVNKIISYETNVYGQEWFHNILLVGGDSFPGLGDPFPYEGEASCNWLMNYMDTFNPEKLFTSDGSLTGSNDFITSFNKGNGFVVYHGHGEQDSLHTYKPYNPNKQEIVDVFDSNQMSQITNGNKLPIMVSGCCLTTDFDVGLFNFITILKNYEKYVNFFDFLKGCIPECLAWDMVKKSDGGAISYLGGTSTGYLVPGDGNRDDIPDLVQTGYTTGLCDEFFRVYGEDNVDVLGDVYQNAITNIVNDFSAKRNHGQCKCVQEFILIGDPSLKIGGYS